MVQLIKEKTFKGGNTKARKCDYCGRKFEKGDIIVHDKVWDIVTCNSFCRSAKIDEL